MAIAEYQPTIPAEGAFEHLPVARIVPATDNPRTNVGDVSDLTASIQLVGILQPVIVGEPAEDGTYPLIAGERRLRAATTLGLDRIPAIVRHFDEVERAVAMSVENTSRVNLTPLEEAAADQRLLDLGLDVATIAQHTGRPVADIDRRLAVQRLPKKVRTMLRNGALEYAEAALLTDVAAHPEDITTALRYHAEWNWTIGQGVARVQRDRERTERAEVTRAALERQKVRVIDTPEHGYLSGQAKQRPLDGYGGVGIARRLHRREPCHAAYIALDGSAVYVCTDPRRHASGRPDGATSTPDARAARAAKRAANTARRLASAGRTTAATALLSGADPVDGLGYLLRAVLDHAPREIAPAAARLLGLDVPEGQRYAASDPAQRALRQYVTAGEDAPLRAALAIHCALAEKDAAAEHEAYGAGAAVLAYTDFLTANGYTEGAGDAANRERYASPRPGLPEPMDDNDDADEPVS